MRRPSQRPNCQKTEGRCCTEGGEAGEDRRYLREACELKLQKIPDECRCWCDELAADLESAKEEDLAGYIAPVAIASATAFKLTVEAFFAEVAGALEGNDFSMSEVKQQHNDLKQDFKDIIRHLREQFKDAAYVASAAEGKTFNKRKAVKDKAKEAGKDAEAAAKPKPKKQKTTKTVMRKKVRRELPITPGDCNEHALCFLLCQR